MYGSQTVAAAKDLNLPFPAAAAGFGHRREESDLQRQQQQMSSGLLRYRSAPSTLLGEVCEDFLPVRPSSPETESLFARFLAPDLRDDKTSVSGLRNPVFMPPPAEQSSGFSSASSQMLYISQNQHQHQRPPPASEIAYRGVCSMAMETEQMKHGGGGTNLIRQSSSPAGFFSHLNVDNGYGLMRGMATSIRNGMVAEAAAGRLKGQISFSSRQNSLSQISEMGSEDISGGGGSPDESSNGRCVVPSYAISAWDDSLLSNSFSGAGSGGLKRTASDVVRLNQTGVQQNGELQNHHVSGLTHQISLPKCPSELPALDKFLQFHDSVPCKTRAKRGCATHPRSIAERVRRTRISERMRKLQELVPNMDKQTNTSDMLDLAVDYIKDLQKQVKSLSDNRRSCTCSASKQKAYQNKAS